MSRDNQADLITLRKRARRRLVGAIALTGIAVGVLWNVVDNAPPNADLRPESVDVVGPLSHLPHHQRLNCHNLTSRLKPLSQPLFHPPQSLSHRRLW